MKAIIEIQKEKERIKFESSLCERGEDPITIHPLTQLKSDTNIDDYFAKGFIVVYGPLWTTNILENLC